MPHESKQHKLKYICEGEKGKNNRLASAEWGEKLIWVAIYATDSGVISCILYFSALDGLDAARWPVKTDESPVKINRNP